MPHPLHTENRVLIIGSGPAGLATAIEASQKGVRVTLVEKRSAYLRDQIFMLDADSLTLLKKWEVQLPEFQAFDLENGKKIQLIAINCLEKALRDKTEELKIKRICGEFKRFSKKGTSATILSHGREMDLAYDLIVGADGAHSLVRAELGIPCEVLGFSIAIAAVLPPLKSFVKTAIFTEKKDTLFIRKVVTPSQSLLMAQRALHPLQEIETIDWFEIIQAMKDCGWIEVEMIEKKQFKTTGNIGVSLQRAPIFFDRKKSALLVGDAAACASFFQGTSGNAALKAALLVGEFCAKLQARNKHAYLVFNRSMNKLVNRLIQDSEFLFETPL